MAKWARIENGTVIEITDIDPNGRFHPDLIWEECADGVAQGWRRSPNGAFTPPAVDTNLTLGDEGANP